MYVINLWCAVLTWPSSSLLLLVSQSVGGGLAEPLEEKAKSRGIVGLDQINRLVLCVNSYVRLPVIGTLMLIVWLGLL